MTKVEKNIIDWINKNKALLFFVAITVLGIVTRYDGRGFVSRDMTRFLLPWYEAIGLLGGFPALEKQIGDYNILYQTIIAALSYLKTNPVYYYKMLSILFDYLLAFTSAVLVVKVTGRKLFDGLFQLVYAVILLLPTVVWNSAYWGQCDSIYSFFVVLTLLLLYKQSYPWAFVAFGVAIAFKLQAIFLLPFLLTYYLYKKRFSILWLLVSLGTFWASGIGGFLYGRSLLAPFEIYQRQSESYGAMYINIYNVWNLTGDQYPTLEGFSIVLCMAILGLGAYFMLNKTIPMESGEDFVRCAAWFVWTCVMFLPNMHDRYAFLADILLICVACMNRKYAPHAAIAVLVSSLSYTKYLFGIEAQGLWVPILYLLTWIHFSVIQANGNKKEEKTAPT